MRFDVEKPVLPLSEIMTTYSSAKNVKALRGLSQLKIGQVDMHSIYNLYVRGSNNQTCFDLKFANKNDAIQDEPFANQANEEIKP